MGAGTAGAAGAAATPFDGPSQKPLWYLLLDDADETVADATGTEAEATALGGPA